ncbi:MAG: hypothetical protein BWY61_01531 [Firmicutes bacterium ADurb.Bin354]|nr:MAG: hypothetical protein BWY61_01531 [Firmicutes bacterium ADurb.Bin354]
MMKKNKKYPFVMTKKALAVFIVFTVLMGLYLFFVRGDMAGKFAACIVCPILIVYLIYVYRKESKADVNAEQKKTQFISGSYFESPEWHEKYMVYIKAHPLEKPAYQSMKVDLLKRFQRREYIFGMMLPLFLLTCSLSLIPMGRYCNAIIGVLLFGSLFWLEFSLFIGMPVRKWLKGDIDYPVLEASYLKSQMLLYKTNALAFGTTHLHGFTENKVYAIDYGSIEGISRKIVRLKKYEDGIYNTEEYQHFAVIHVRLPESGETQDVEIELNEFQVQMAIDKLPTYKIGEDLREKIFVNDKYE